MINNIPVPNTPHPLGESARKEEIRLETMGGTLRVEWERDVSVSLYGALGFFTQMLKDTGGLAAQESTVRLMGWTRDRRVDEHAALVTTLNRTLVELVQLYRDRADSENAFDELKNQWGWKGSALHLGGSNGLPLAMTFNCRF